MRDQSKPDYRPDWLKACDGLKKNVVAVEPKPVIYAKHPVGPRPVRQPRKWRKAPVRRDLTPRALTRNTEKRNDMPGFVGAVMAYHRKQGRATPNADARRTNTA